MYKRLSLNQTKENYRNILNETIQLIEASPDIQQNLLYQGILYQLNDIKRNVVEEGNYLSWEDVDDHYTLGGIAMKNFTDGEEMQNRLIDIFGGACDYYDYPEE